MLKSKAIVILAFFLALTTSLAAKEKIYPGKDPAIANNERILYWLDKRGELPINATDLDKQNALKKYLLRTKNGHYQPPVNVLKAEAQAMHRVKERLAQETKALKAGTEKTVKILAVLVDFPDLPYNDNRLTNSDTNMYYSDYPTSHYQDLVFSHTGYVGPSSQNLMSAYQYYQQESGGTLIMEGQAYGWVRANSNAATYGGNDPDDNDNDIDVPTLVKEAVTKAVQENSINLADYDHEDQYDIDGDGNVNEPDGYIDHVMIFHASMGEEAGGGVLGDDAIWSHRFFVDASSGGYDVPGTSHKLYGYTIEPIDSAVGVVVHEFGHDLGLRDEYDTHPDSEHGSPVGYWSLMASGSWTGSPAGTNPTGFSPLARDYFQQRYAGDWADIATYDYSGLQQQSELVTLTEAVDADATVNMVRVNVPGGMAPFYAPYSGSMQYYSGFGDLKNHSMSFNLNVPTGTTLSLQMKSHWNIEQDYDYVQVLVDNVAIEGNHTDLTNQYHASVQHFISGRSLDIAGAEGTVGWVDLTFDLSAYAGTTVAINIQYITDPSVGDYGFVVDDIKLMADGSEVYSDGAEDNPVMASLNGFSVIGDSRSEGDKNYYIQMRSFNGVDVGLTSRNYAAGMLVWFGDPDYSNNQSFDHPGHGFISVVDANQNLLRNGSNVPYSTSTQIRDAAFSQYGAAVSTMFSDMTDYSSPEQPDSGVVLPRNGLQFSIQTQAVDSSSASILLEVVNLIWDSEFSLNKTYQTVAFSNDSSGVGDATAVWDFGDGNSSTDWAPTHVYSASGSYTVNLTITTTADGSTVSSSQTVSIAEQLSTGFNAQDTNGLVDFSTTASGGEQPLIYSWDFGDGSTAGSGASVSHQYTQTGDYIVTLTVDSADGQQSVVTTTVAVYLTPVAEFTAARNYLVVTFTDQSTGGDGALSYAWDFGDGNTSTDASPTHTYTAAGSFSVSLTITDQRSTTHTVSQTVTVAEAPPPPPTQSSGGGGSTGIWFFFGLVIANLIRRKALYKAVCQLA